MAKRRSASPGRIFGAGTDVPPGQLQEHPGDQVAVPGPLTSDAQQSEPELISSVYAATLSARTTLANLFAEGPEADCSVFTDAGERRPRRGEGD